MTNAELVRLLWESYQARDWEVAKGLFSAGATCVWPTSNETFRGGEIVAVNEMYPEGWSIEIEEISELPEGRVLSIVRVEHPPNTFYATSVFRLQSGRILDLTEYWATVEEPPSWRKKGQ